MPRIRTIKPDFFTSEKIVELDPLARLFFIGLWCEADREGRLAWKPKTLKFRYLPADDCDMEALSNQLTQQELIELYENDGKMYCQVSGFNEHQVVNNRERQSVIPAPNDASTTRKRRVKAERKGKEGKGKEGLVIPDGINLDAWKEWEAFRKDKKKPVSQAAAKKQFKLLLEYSSEVQQQIIDNSIQNDYQGLFKPKGNNQNLLTVPASGDLIDFAKKHGLSEPGERMTEFDYRRALEAEIKTKGITA